MDTTITLMVEIEVNPGKEAAFKDVLHDLVAAVEREEPGVLAYGAATTDGRKYHALEVYRDSDTVLSHMKVLGRFLERIMACAAPKKVVAFGPANAAAREALAGFQPLWLDAKVGFVRA